MWDAIFQIGASILVGVALGYAVAAIVNSLSQPFAELWKGFVKSAQYLWGTVKEATQHLLARIAQWLEQAWQSIESYLLLAIGYRRWWRVSFFTEARTAFIKFVDPLSQQNKSYLFSMGVLDKNEEAQLPTQQNSIEHVLTIEQ
ncbi:hypothetical protein DOP62_14130 (plasmid) [Synechococcus elongatus PCC 11801]|uniref:Uncharacterized protein n=1 Tax=Synechococcus elongatus PCC 11801 TaxID=2219813 RepID=A0ACD5A653_SYNEL